MKLKDAITLASSIGVRLTKVDDEYRVALKGKTIETEPHAYYTNDLDDAIQTAGAISVWCGKR